MPAWTVATRKSDEAAIGRRTRCWASAPRSSGRRTRLPSRRCLRRWWERLPRPACCCRPSPSRTRVPIDADSTTKKPRRGTFSSVSPSSVSSLTDKPTAEISTLPRVSSQWTTRVSANNDNNKVVSYCKSRLGV